MVDLNSLWISNIGKGQAEVGLPLVLHSQVFVDGFPYDFSKRLKLEILVPI